MKRSKLGETESGSAEFPPRRTFRGRSFEVFISFRRDGCPGSIPGSLYASYDADDWNGRRSQATCNAVVFTSNGRLQAIRRVLSGMKSKSSIPTREREFKSEYEVDCSLLGRDGCNSKARMPRQIIETDVRSARLPHYEPLSE